MWTAVGVPRFELGTSRTRSILAVQAVKGFMDTDEVNPWTLVEATTWGYLIMNCFSYQNHD